MQTCVPEGAFPGASLARSTSTARQTLGVLFAALLLSALFIYAGANLLFNDPIVLQRTTPIALGCAAVALVFAAVSHKMASVAWGLAITYGWLWFVTLVQWSWLTPVSYGGALLALAYLAMRLRPSRMEAMLAVLMALLCAAVALGNSTVYTSFDMLQRLQAGAVHHDTLFHASIAAMVKQYGVVSTGLNGLVDTPYHAFSHQLFAAISLLTGTPVLEVYGVAPAMLFIPVLVFSVVHGSLALSQRPAENAPLIWGIVCGLFVVIPLALQFWAFWDSYLVSESYLIALGLFSVGLPLLYKRQLTLADYVVTAVLATMIAHAKVSVGMMFAGLWFTRLVLLRPAGRWAEWAGFALISVIIALAVMQPASANGSVKIVILDFIGSYSLFGMSVRETVAYLSGKPAIYSPLLALLTAVSLGSFFVLHFLFSWLTAASAVFHLGLRAAFRAPATLYSLAAIFGSTLIIAVFAIPGGAVYYFSNVAFFVSLPICATLFAARYERIATGLAMTPSASTPLGLVVLLLILVPISEPAVHAAYAKHQQYRNHHSEFIDALRALRTEAPHDGVLRSDAVFMAQSPHAECWSRPFVYPAVSERAWTGVIVPTKRCAYQYYGFEQYGLTPEHQTVDLPPTLLPGMRVLEWSSKGSPGR